MVYYKENRYKNIHYDTLYNYTTVLKHGASPSTIVKRVWLSHGMAIS